MNKSVWFAFVLVAVLVLAVPSAGNAACPAPATPAITPGAAAESLPLFLQPQVSLAKIGSTTTSSDWWACCGGAYEECELRCTQGIKQFWCDPDGCGPECCAMQCECWIWE